MRLIIVIAGLLMSTLNVNAAAFEKNLKGRSGSAVITAEKPVVVGVNTLRFHVLKQGKAVEGEVMVKVFMPAMPYMEDKAVAKALGNGDYEVDIALSMGGTWQIHIFVTPKNGKKFRLKSSLNI